MTNFMKKFNNTSDKFGGKVKEAAGKITGNEQLELQGKIQSSKADLKKKWNIKDRVEDLKENIAGKVNDRLDARNEKEAENKKP